MDFDNDKMLDGYSGGDVFGGESPFTQEEPQLSSVLGGSVIGSFRNGNYARGTVEAALIVSLLMLVFVLFWGWSVPGWMWLLATGSVISYALMEGYLFGKVVPMV